MTEYWTDHLGVRRRVSRIRGSLLFSQISAHAALRAYVFHRDGFSCRACGATAVAVPDVYRGDVSLFSSNKSHLEVDHIVSRRNGGSHHPDNLQCLCSRCNGRKSVLVDRKGTV